MKYFHLIPPKLCYYWEHIYYITKRLEGMKANRILLAIIAAILTTQCVLTGTISAQTNTDDGTTGGGADDESPSDMYEEFQTCLENEERTGGTIGFVLEGDIRACFIDAGYIQDDDNEDEDEEVNDDEE
jgi:hypothetical protein